jgi:PPOX class probable F420-dependent enzyme
MAGTTPPAEPTASRPYMPDYGIAAEDEGAGLLPWSWAVQRLTQSHDYWIATVRPDGRPHVAPVWGVWMDDVLVFSTGPRSRKANNLRHQPRATATTDNAAQPVMVEGTATLITDRAMVTEFTRASNTKYDVDYSVDFYLENDLFRLMPEVAFGLDSADFIGTPTRWQFSH